MLQSMLMAVFSKQEAALFGLLYYNVYLNVVLCQEQNSCHIYQKFWQYCLWPRCSSWSFYLCMNTSKHRWLHLHKIKRGINVWNCHSCDIALVWVNLLMFEYTICSLIIHYSINTLARFKKKFFKKVNQYLYFI